MQTIGFDEKSANQLITVVKLQFEMFKVFTATKHFGYSNANEMC